MTQHVIFLLAFLVLVIIDIIFWVKNDLLNNFVALQTTVFIEQTTLLIPINYVICIHNDVLQKTKIV